jgi:beta-eliminating lyase
MQSPLEHHLLQISVAKQIPEVPADTQQNNLGLEVTPFEWGGGMHEIGSSQFSEYRRVECILAIFQQNQLTPYTDGIASLAFHERLATGVLAVMQCVWRRGDRIGVRVHLGSRKERRMLDTPEAKKIFKACNRFLTHDYPKSPRQVLSELAEMTDPELEADRYGQGEVITRFEREVAALLGKEAAVFMPSGTMCQQIALRIWAQRRGTSNVAFHPKSHLETHEEKAYQRLHGLNGILVGSAERLLTLDDLKAIAEPVGALLIELPQRDLGGQLPGWEALNEVIEWARERAIPTHLDGARLWECRPFYGREYAEIARLFDSVYVSFYKILGGIAGSILAGQRT